MQEDTVLVTDHPHSDAGSASDDPSGLDTPGQGGSSVKFFEKFTVIGALLRIAEAIEEHNRLTRVISGVPDPKMESHEPVEASVTHATDKDSYENEIADRREANLGFNPEEASQKDPW
jgi:hypothetical protein